MKRFLCLVVTTLVCAICLANTKVVIVSEDGNGGIYESMLKQAKRDVKVVSSFEDALACVSKGDGVILRSPGYPYSRASVSDGDYQAAKAKSLRLFVEFPSIFPSGESGENYSATLERGVVISSKLGLPAMSIVGINGCTLVKSPVCPSKSLLVLAKVAGFDTAVFGLTDKDVQYPVLYQDKSVLVATTSFSNCVIGRFGPADSWNSIITYILRYVTSDNKLAKVRLPRDPQPSYGRTGKLPEGAYCASTVKAGEWLWKARLFIHPTWEKELMRKYQPVGGNPNKFFGQPITEDLMQGDGCRGIMEGHGSNVHFDGTQDYRYFIRADVHGESAFLLAACKALTGDDKYSQTAEKLLDYLFYTSDFRDGTKGDKNASSYGMIGWANTAPGAFFNDDNARCVLGTIGASALMGNQRWNRFIVDNIMAMYRLSSPNGFIGSCLSDSEIEEKGWKYYNERADFVNPSPHFESWAWSLYLWLYGRTGYKPLLDKAKAGISYMMKVYPNWLVQNGLQQERARMVLPLAWLVRAEDTPQHRQWLKTVVDTFLENQVECGAVREALGSAESDHNNLLITSNSEYGKNEASLIARNGDPVADMLYTCNFGFFGLNEAVAATGEPAYAEALGKLADFIARIQVRSDAHPDLDGAWFRAFDFGRWDYWASNADDGWGAWCTLCGWIETWLGVTEYLVGKGTSYWDITSGMDMSKCLDNDLWMINKTK